MKQKNNERMMNEGMNKSKFEMSKDEMIVLMRKINNGRKDNAQNRRYAYDVLVGSFPVGGKVYAIISLDRLHIDNAYQRTLQNHVKTIAREWDDIKCDPLKVNYREDGFFYVWNGQHRKGAAEMVGLEYLLCDITVGLTQEDEAKLFGGQGVGLKKPNPYDIFKANVCSGDGVDVSIKDMCDSYGLLVSRGNKAGNLSCLTLARTIFSKGEEEYFEWALCVLHEAKWNEFPKSHCHKIVSALYEIGKDFKEENEFCKRKLLQYLKTSTPERLVVSATIKYPQFNADDKKIKLFLKDVINEEEIVRAGHMDGYGYGRFDA